MCQVGCPGMGPLSVLLILPRILFPTWLGLSFPPTPVSLSLRTSLSTCLKSQLPHSPGLSPALLGFVTPDPLIDYKGLCLCPMSSPLQVDSRRQALHFVHCCIPSGLPSSWHGVGSVNIGWMNVCLCPNTDPKWQTPVQNCQVLKIHPFDVVTRMHFIYYQV